MKRLSATIVALAIVCGAIAGCGEQASSPGPGLVPLQNGAQAQSQEEIFTALMEGEILFYIYGYVAVDGTPPWFNTFENRYDVAVKFQQIAGCVVDDSILEAGRIQRERVFAAVEQELGADALEMLEELLFAPDLAASDDGRH